MMADEGMIFPRGGISRRLVLAGAAAAAGLSRAARSLGSESRMTFHQADATCLGSGPVV